MERISVIPKRVLHAGCGRDPLPAWLEGSIETRLDIDPAMNPDVLASMTDLGDIGPFDVVLCQHALEHVHAHEAPLVLAEFRRVLAADGFVVIVVPDLEDVRATDEVLFIAPAGPITGLDLIYGKRSMIQEHPAMAHKNGFTQASLRTALQQHFPRAETRRLWAYNLIGVGACK